MGLRLLGGRIAILPDEAKTTTDAGIELLSVEDKVQSGTIKYVGPGTRDDRGKFTPTVMNVGDRVTFMKANAQEIEFEGETLLVTDEDSILAVVDNG